MDYCNNHNIIDDNYDYIESLFLKYVSDNNIDYTTFNLTKIYDNLPYKENFSNTLDKFFNFNFDIICKKSCEQIVNLDLYTFESCDDIKIYVQKTVKDVIDVMLENDIKINTYDLDYKLFNKHSFDVYKFVLENIIKENVSLFNDFMVFYETKIAKNKLSINNKEILSPIEYNNLRIDKEYKKKIQSMIKEMIIEKRLKDLKKSLIQKIFEKYIEILKNEKDSESICLYALLN